MPHNNGGYLNAKEKENKNFDETFSVRKYLQKQL
jgi:hypothetical protein